MRLTHLTTGALGKRYFGYCLDNNSDGSETFNDDKGEKACIAHQDNGPIGNDGAGPKCHDFTWRQVIGGEQCYSKEGLIDDGTFDFLCKWFGADKILTS
ncbi:hypothetical protein HYALB_00010190 [Hymenoscyphus albidus]|uniref:Uncharacterized protein n=1 Tax=Hymenoscyphus albidus TaxID=595503 RepID=A0A9N9PWZ9_9HELO|nr:hypothetical protein HYALB_00010190 [Hymenoscyphus albidus]